MYKDMYWWRLSWLFLHSSQKCFTMSRVAEIWLGRSSETMAPVYTLKTLHLNGPRFLAFQVTWSHWLLNCEWTNKHFVFRTWGVQRQWCRGWWRVLKLWHHWGRLDMQHRYWVDLFFNCRSITGLPPLILSSVPLVYWEIENKANCNRGVLIWSPLYISYVHIYIYVCTYIYTYIRLHTCIQILFFLSSLISKTQPDTWHPKDCPRPLPTYLWLWTGKWVKTVYDIDTYIYEYIYVHIRMYIYIYIRIYMYTYMCICIYIYIYIYIYTHTYI